MSPKTTTPIDSVNEKAKISPNVNAIAPQGGVAGWLVGLIVLLVAGVFSVIGLMVGIIFVNDKEEINDIDNAGSNSAVVDESQDTTNNNALANTSSKLVVTSPKTGDTVNGRIEVSGTAPSSILNVSVSVIDDNGVVLGQKDISVKSGTWKDTIDILISPTAPIGSINFHGSSTGSDTKPTDDVLISIDFQTSNSDGRLKVLSPLPNQLLAEGKLTLRGEMMGFFEGTGNVRIQLSNGGSLYETYFMGNEENYSQYASFEKEVVFGSVPTAAGDTGFIEFYDVSAMDGSETTLLLIPVRFDN